MGILSRGLTGPHNQPLAAILAIVVACAAYYDSYFPSLIIFDSGIGLIACFGGAGSSRQSQ